MLNLTPSSSSSDLKLDVKNATAQGISSPLREKRPSAFSSLSHSNLFSSKDNHLDSLTSSPLGSSASRRGGSVPQRWGVQEDLLHTNISGGSNMEANSSGSSSSSSSSSSMTSALASASTVATSATTSAPYNANSATSEVQVEVEQQDEDATPENDLFGPTTPFVPYVL